jgi:hypothetical protein
VTLPAEQLIDRSRKRTIARGAGSGIEMEVESLTIWTFNDEGKVTRV